MVLCFIVQSHRVIFHHIPITILVYFMHLFLEFLALLKFFSSGFGIHGRLGNIFYKNVLESEAVCLLTSSIASLMAFFNWLLTFPLSCVFKNRYKLLDKLPRISVRNHVKLMCVINSRRGFSKGTVLSGGY